MSERSEGTPLTMPAMQRELGLKGKGFEDPEGRGLLRVLESRERALKVRFILRGGGGRGRGNKVTKTAIRKYAPELLPSKVDALKRDVSRFVADIDSRIADGAAKHVDRFVEPRLEEQWGKIQEISKRTQELWERDETLAEQVDQILKRIEKLICPPM